VPLIARGLLPCRTGFLPKTIMPRRRVSVHDSEMSYVTVGGGDPIVFLHGNPTSSYLWRNVIPHVTDLGWCLAPDLIGMGPVSRLSKRCLPLFWIMHIISTHGFEALDLRRNVTLVLHDWGIRPRLSLGFKVSRASTRPSLTWSRWSSRATGKTFPPAGRRSFATCALRRVERMILDENTFIEILLPKLIIRTLTKAEMDAYRLPFREPEVALADACLAA